MLNKDTFALAIYLMECFNIYIILLLRYHVKKIIRKAQYRTLNCKAFYLIHVFFLNVMIKEPYY